MYRCILYLEKQSTSESAARSTTASGQRTADRRLKKGGSPVKRFLGLVLTGLVSLASLPAAGVSGASVRAVPMYNHTPGGTLPGIVRQAYGFDKLSYDGSGNTVAIISAYEYPAAAADLQVFVNEFGMKNMNGLPGTPACTVAAGPHPCFQQVSVASAGLNGPLFFSFDSTWHEESATDVQWTHTIAQGADILLVQANTSQPPDMLKAIDTAVDMGASIVSMSFAIPESADQLTWDTHLNKPGVLFVASSGDWGSQAQWPASAPNVVAVGGTSLNANVTNGVLNSKTETVWNLGVNIAGSVGGPSAFEAEPSWQQAFQTSGKRGVPDVAYSAAPGFPVFVDNDWRGYGGTSAGTPQWAGLFALVNQAGNAHFTDVSKLYAAATANYGLYFNDITEGVGGCNTSACAAKPGYDFATGLGTPKADQLVYYLAGVPAPAPVAPAPAPAPAPVPTAADCGSFTCATLFTTSINGTAGYYKVNYQKLELTAGQTVNLQDYADGPVSVMVYDANSKLVTSWGCPTDGYSSASFTATAGGTYYVGVMGRNGTVHYTLTLR